MTNRSSIVAEMWDKIAQPLQVIITDAAVIASRASATEEDRAGAERIERATERLINLRKEEGGEGARCARNTEGDCPMEKCGASGRACPLAVPTDLEAVTKERDALLRVLADIKPIDQEYAGRMHEVCPVCDEVDKHGSSCAAVAARTALGESQ